MRLFDSDYLLYYNDIQSKSPSEEVSLAEWVALCSACMDRPVTEATAIVGEIRLSGSMGQVHNVADVIRVAKNAGAHRVLLPRESMADLMQVPAICFPPFSRCFMWTPLTRQKRPWRFSTDEFNQNRKV